MGVDDNNLRTLIGRIEGIEEVTVRETHNVLGERSNLIGLALSKGIGDFIALSTESVNDVGSGELTILLRASGGVVGLEHLRANGSDFGIGECEHSLVCLSIFWSFLFRGGELSLSPPDTDSIHLLSYNVNTFL
jgi:hypothetical protein